MPGKGPLDHGRGSAGRPIGRGVQCSQPLSAQRTALPLPGVLVDRPALVGEIDMVVADDLLADLRVRVGGDPSPTLEIDCSQLTFIDSSRLAMLVALRAETGTNLVLYGIPEHCRQPFVVTRLDAVFVLRAN